MFLIINNFKFNDLIDFKSGAEPANNRAVCKEAGRAALLPCFRETSVHKHCIYVRVYWRMGYPYKATPPLQAKWVFNCLNSNKGFQRRSLTTYKNHCGMPQTVIWQYSPDTYNPLAYWKIDDYEMLTCVLSVYNIPDVAHYIV